MGKCSKLPDHNELFHRKTPTKKREPVWVYLEREMRQNIDRKPYNKTVGEWLIYLKGLTLYLRREAKKKLDKLKNDGGPPWYLELNYKQKELLGKLSTYIHQDLLEDIPVRVQKFMKDYGLLLKLPPSTLLKIMQNSAEEPASFLWYLFTKCYKVPPCTELPAYDMNAKLIISALVFIDMEDCIVALGKLLPEEKKVEPKPPKVKRQPPVPKVKYGVYLQETVYHSDKPTSSTSSTLKKKKAAPDHQIQLRSEQSYENLFKDMKFIDERKKIHKLKTSLPQQRERDNSFGFNIRLMDNVTEEYLAALKMLKRKARPKHLDFNHGLDENTQFHVGAVTYSGGKPNYVISSIANLDTGYIIINGGAVRYKTEYVTLILGHCQFGEDIVGCKSDCDCLEKWGKSVMKHLEESKCKCFHFYDLNQQGKLNETYFYKPTKYGPYWIDQAKIYQLDPWEDFIKEKVAASLRSESNTVIMPTHQTTTAKGLPIEKLLEALLGELAVTTTLTIPHLAFAKKILILREWVKKYVKKEVRGLADHKRLKLKAEHQWRDLGKVNFRVPPKNIVFSQDELKLWDFSKRKMLQKLYLKIISDFIRNNTMRQLEHTRLFWTTMAYEIYPGPRFMECFFTYMPAKMNDLYLLRPYDPSIIDKYGGKTCPFHYVKNIF